MADKQQLLHRYWGYDTFRPLQGDIVDAVVQGLDVLALLPTGGGKSVCYQLPALLREGLCLVVSPLIALMKDQVQQLNDRRLKAACIVSGMSGEEVRRVLYNAIAGELKYLYVSPERLRQRLFLEHLRQMKVGLIAVDEAHCISQWGYDFRPPYLQIADVRTYHPAAPLIALTATATPAVEEDICRLLRMPQARRFRASFARPNLVYRVWHGGDKTGYLLDLLLRSEGSAIVYVRNRRLTQQTADLLNGHGVSAAAYHAGLEAAERDRRQALWMQGKLRVMVATNAFGMGIDKPDVRYVVHLEAPDSVEAYFQEAGRAGRDGKPAEAVLLYAEADRSLLAHHLDTDFPTLKEIRNVYRALCNHYQLPMGSGADSRFDFDLQALCATYGFGVRLFYSACRFLEREGLIALPEREEACSTLFIPLRRDELYRFQVDHMVLGNLLQVLLRMYPGLFTGSTPVDEGKVAARCFMERGEVCVLLSQLHAMHVVDYRPRPEKPQILFPTARINEKDLFPADEHYQMLHDTARCRLEAMLRYAENDTVCRQRQLLEYFGEKSDEDCGRCDVCLHQKEREEVETMRRKLDEGGLYLDENLSLNAR